MKSLKILFFTSLTAIVLGVLAQNNSLQNQLNQQIENQTRMTNDMEAMQQELQYQKSTQTDFLEQSDNLTQLLETVQQGVVNRNATNRNAN